VRRGGNKSKAAQKDVDARWTLKLSKPVATPKPALAIPGRFQRRRGLS
jgi:hypothetical protein